MASQTRATDSTSLTSQKWECSLTVSGSFTKKSLPLRFHSHPKVLTLLKAVKVQALRVLMTSLLTYSLSFEQSMLYQCKSKRYQPLKNTSSCQLERYHLGLFRWAILKLFQLHLKKSMSFNLRPFIKLNILLNLKRFISKPYKGPNFNKAQVRHKNNRFLASTTKFLFNNNYPQCNNNLLHMQTRHPVKRVSIQPR